MLEVGLVMDRASQRHSASTQRRGKTSELRGQNTIKSFPMYITQSVVFFNCLLTGDLQSKMAPSSDRICGILSMHLAQLSEHSSSVSWL